MNQPERKSRGEELDFGLVTANQRLSPEERLNAFLTHNRLMMELYKAGLAARTPAAPQKQPLATESTC